MVAVAITFVAVGCSSGPSVPPQGDQVPIRSGYWDDPLGASGRTVAMSRAFAAGHLSFPPVVPALPVAPTRVEVLRRPGETGRTWRHNPLVLVYHLPRAWGFTTSDTRVVIREVGAEGNEPDSLPSARKVSLGQGITGLLVTGRPDNHVLVGRVLFTCREIRFDTTGPAAAPTAMERLARVLVSACRSTI